MTNMVFKDLLPLFCSNVFYTHPEQLGHSPSVPPITVVGHRDCLENEELAFNLESEYEIGPFGSDCNGGYAYFGLTSDLDQHWLHVLDYIRVVSETCTKTSEAPPYAARWTLKNKYDVVVLYDDYDRRNIMTTPSTPHVLEMQFGAWTNDDTLDMVVCDKGWETEWAVGPTVFDSKNEEHKALRRLARKVMKTLVPTTNE